MAMRNEEYTKIRDSLTNNDFRVLLYLESGQSELPAVIQEKACFKRETKTIDQRITHLLDLQLLRRAGSSEYAISDKGRDFVIAARQHAPDFYEELTNREEVKASAAPDLIESFIILVLSVALSIVLFWMASRSLGEERFEGLPTFITQGFTAIWSAAAAGAAGIGLALKNAFRNKGRAHPNYLKYIGLTVGSIIALVMIIMAVTRVGETQTALVGVVSKQSDAADGRLSLNGVDITSELATTPVKSKDGIFTLFLRPGVRRGQTITLHFRHPDYQSLDLPEVVMDKQYLVHLIPKPASYTPETPSAGPADHWKKYSGEAVFPGEAIHHREGQDYKALHRLRLCSADDEGKILLGWAQEKPENKAEITCTVTFNGKLDSYRDFKLGVGTGRWLPNPTKDDSLLQLSPGAFVCRSLPPPPRPAQKQKVEIVPSDLGQAARDARNDFGDCQLQDGKSTLRPGKYEVFSFR